MFNTLERLYDNGSIDEQGLTNAVNLGWITEEEKNSITEK